MTALVILALIVVFLAVVLVRAALFKPKAQELVDTGEVSFDEWDNFVATIERMDLAGYYELVQRAVDNYNK